MPTLREHIANMQKLTDLMPPDMHDVRAVTPLLAFIAQAIPALEYYTVGQHQTLFGPAAAVLAALDKQV